MLSRHQSARTDAAIAGYRVITRKGARPRRSRQERRSRRLQRGRGHRLCSLRALQVRYATIGCLRARALRPCADSKFTATLRGATLGPESPIQARRKLQMPPLGSWPIPRSQFIPEICHVRVLRQLQKAKCGVTTAPTPDAPKLHHSVHEFWRSASATIRGPYYYSHES